MDKMIDKGIQSSLANIVWVIGVIFMAGIAYSEIKFLDAKLEEQSILFNERIHILDQRLDKKIKELNEAEDKINRIEIELAKQSACK